MTGRPVSIDDVARKAEAEARRLEQSDLERLVRLGLRLLVAYVRWKTRLFAEDTMARHEALVRILREVEEELRK